MPDYTPRAPDAATIWEEAGWCLNRLAFIAGGEGPPRPDDDEAIIRGAIARGQQAEAERDALWPLVSAAHTFLTLCLEEGLTNDDDLDKGTNGMVRAWYALPAAVRARLAQEAP